MEITVKEVMRLRKELAAYVSTAIAALSSAVTGKSTLTLTDGSKEDKTPEGTSIAEAITHVETLMVFEEELNEKFAQFNVEQAIGRKIRMAARLDDMLKRMKSVTGKLKASEKEVQVKTPVGTLLTGTLKFEPFMAQKAARTWMKEIAAAKRQAQVEVETSDAQTLQFSFSYDDIEEHTAWLEGRCDVLPAPRAW